MMIWGSRVHAPGPGDGDILCSGEGRDARRGRRGLIPFHWNKAARYSSETCLSGIRRVVIPMEWNKEGYLLL